jgi:hypothetical protein
MWIVPKTLSAFVPATTGLNLELRELAWMFEQSVTWRSKFMSKQYWLRRFKKNDYVKHLCGLTLKPSQHKSFVDSWTGSLVATRANHLAVLESEKEKKTPDTYGPTSVNTSKQLDLAGFLPKTSKDIYRLDSPQSSAIWKKMVTKRRGEYSARKKQALLTKEKGSISWPSARTSDAEGGPIKTEMTEKGFRSRREKSNQYFGAKLRDAVETHENWATPNTMDHLKTRSDEGVKKIATGARKGRRRPSNLREQVDERTCQIYREQNWPTPRAGNPGSRKPGTGGKILAEEAKIHAGPPAQEKSSTSGNNHGSPKLNPNWVEQLMGLPVGWTQLPTEWTDYDSSATALSPKPQN